MPETAIDLSGLDPPEPLLRILETLEAAGPGPHVFLLSREPFPLYPLIAASGWSRRLRRVEKGFELTVYRAAPDSKVP